MVPLEHGVHRPPVPAVPAGHGSQLPSGPTTWLLPVVWLPSGHTLQALSEVGVGSTVTVDPASQVAWVVHLASLAAAAKVPVWQAWHTRFCDGVPSTDTCSPGAHTSHAAHPAAFCVVENVPAGHAEQVRSETAVEPDVSRWPGTQVVVFEHTRSVLGVGAATVCSPSGQVAKCALHRPWSMESENVSSGQGAHTTSAELAA